MRRTDRVLRAAARRFRRPVIGALVLLAALPASAHLPEYFGRKFVLVDSPSAPESETACGGDRDALRRQSTALDERLRRLERELGVYTPALVEPAGELGELYASLCNHPAALDAYRRAIQLLRINEGLLTTSQLPYVRSLADSSQAIGDYRSAQLTLRYAFRIHGMGLESLSATALADALAYFRRARELFIDPRTPDDLDLFYQAYQDNLAMYRAQMARAREGNGVRYADRRAIALSHLRNLYLLLGTDLDAARFASNDPGSAAWNFMYNAQGLIFGEGVDVLEALLGEPEAAQGVERAQLLLRLGNWQQWNEKTRSACDSYASAWVAAEGEAGAALRRRLAAPAELPEDPALWESLLRRDIPVRAVVEAGFRVSARGHISAVKGGTIDADRAAVGGRVIRWLRDSHARPAVKDGACVDGELNGRRYHLVD